MHASIGQLNSGKFYAYLHGYNAEPTLRDSAQALEALLNGEQEQSNVAVATKPQQPASKTYTVTARFQYPAWNMVNGIEYPDITAVSRSEANAIARGMAESDGHLGWGQGRVTFTASEEE